MNHGFRALCLAILALAAAAAVAPPAPADAAEIIFRGTGISMPSPFVCGDQTEPAGRYDVAATYEPQPNEHTTMLVQKGDKTLCEVKGVSSRANNMSTQKIRLMTRINSQMQAIELSLVMPASLRSRIPNQVFYLPLPAKN